MSLNIKDPEALDLASRVAAIAGESLTEAVMTALRERLMRVVEQDALAAELLSLGKDCAARIKESWRSARPNAFLYDERGLPK